MKCAKLIYVYGIVGIDVVTNLFKP